MVCSCASKASNANGCAGMDLQGNHSQCGGSTMICLLVELLPYRPWYSTSITESGFSYVFCLSNVHSYFPGDWRIGKSTVATAGSCCRKRKHHSQNSQGNSPFQSHTWSAVWYLLSQSCFKQHLSSHSFSGTNCTMTLSWAPVVFHIELTFFFAFLPPTPQ